MKELTLAGCSHLYAKLMNTGTQKSPRTLWTTLELLQLGSDTESKMGNGSPTPHTTAALDGTFT